MAYEPHSGARRPGRSGDGTFGAGTSRTVAGPPDEVLARWSTAIAGRAQADGVPLRRPPTTAVTEQCRCRRVRPADGTRVAATIGDKGSGRTMTALVRTGLGRADDVERWRAVRKEPPAGLWDRATLVRQLTPRLR